MNVFLKKNRKRKLIILDIPLLLENKINKRKDILIFIEKFKKKFPNIAIHRINEMYSSKDAIKALIDSGVKKKKRKDKKLLDSTAATILLQEFLYK